jgi:subtilisin family serine protease
MKNRFALGLTLALLLQTLPLGVLGQKTNGDNSLSEKQTIQVSESKPKLAPDLAEETEALSIGAQEDKTQRVIVQLSDSKAEQLRAESFGMPSQTDTKRPVDKTGILMSDFAAHDGMQTKMKDYQGAVKKTFDTMGLMVVDLPLSKVREMANDSDVVYISPDRPVESFGEGHIEIASMASYNDARTEIDDDLTLTGKNIGIAVLDSGIDTTHNSMKASLSHPGVIYSKTYTSNAATSDKYGHGTHVAGILSASNSFKSGNYKGIAYGAKIINLAVLDDQGKGSASNVIAAIDWVIANKSTYNIRVINMSLGGIAKDSYTTDPLCLAARRAVDAGIVVVVSAGNNGKDANGNKLYGGISSPGIDPSVITVGAVNTFGTNTRTDDSVATFSSRGPTRGYIQTNGVKKFDNLIKPDLVAPGNKLVAPLSPSSSGQSNSLITRYPSLAAGGGSKTADKMMYLRGTSMATPVVSGVVALMLEAKPSLTPALVKAILMYTAQLIPGANTFEQGAGQVNAEGAVQVAGAVKSNLSSLSNGAWMLDYSLGSPDDTLSATGETIYWGQGVITDYCFLYGSDLMTKWQGMYGQGKILADSTSVSNGVIVKDFSLMSTGVLSSNGAVTTNGVLMGDGVLISDGVLLADGVLMGDGVILADGVLISESVLYGDNAPRGDDALYGDNTACMPPAP